MRTHALGRTRGALEAGDILPAFVSLIGQPAVSRLVLCSLAAGSVCLAPGRAASPERFLAIAYEESELPP
jgi:hypothetical protein